MDTFLVSRQRGLRVNQLDPEALKLAFRQNIAPISFAIQPDLPLIRPPAPVPTPAPEPEAALATPQWEEARSRQAAQVLNDPRYLLDTGLKFGCPTCGSTNLADVGQAQGTGLMYFGGLAWVLAASVIDHALAKSLSGHKITCNYCGSSFVI